MAAGIRKKRASASSLFLTELMVAILFFALAATLCITVFVKAHLLSSDAGELNHALNITSDGAEIIRTSDSMRQIDEQLIRLYPGAVSTTSAEGEDWIIYFDDEYYPMDKDHYTQYEKIHIANTNSLLHATLTFYNSRDNEVYSQDVSHFIREVD